MKEKLKTLIAEYWDSKPAYVHRHLVPADLAAMPLVLTGPRRAGKSYTIHELRDSLLSQKNARNSIYLNFEDERLIGFKSGDFEIILEAYYELRKEKPILFLDEIQNIEGWERFARRLSDTGYHTIVTGSNSRMLSREIAGQLGGRFANFAIYPLDFREFMSFNKLHFKKEFLYSKERFKIQKMFGEYFHYGGFPNVSILSQETSKKNLLDVYFNLVFYRDVVSRNAIKNEGALKFLVKKLRENIGNIISPRALYASLKAADIPVGPNTVEHYLDYLEGAFLTLPCFPFEKSVLKQEKKKRYFVDNGYIKIFDVKGDNGILLENFVFTELLKYGKQVHYYKGKKECDFIVAGEEAIQATYVLSEGNYGREVNGLVEAVKFHGLKTATIVTWDQEKEIEHEGLKIKVSPAWKWCLSLKKD